MSTWPEVSTQEALDAIYTDTLMLLDEEWEPDYDSTEAHLDMIQRIADNLGITLTDTRG